MNSNDNRGADRPRTPQKPPPEIDHVARIDAITRNARTTWFALLAALVFVGVTLLGVYHIDFWGVGRATALPLVGVEVPTRLFFGAAPILTAAIYCYFHIYLIRLWEALGKAPSDVDGQHLGLAVTPWLVTDAALWLRKRLRRDEDPPCLPERSLDAASAILNLLVAWVFGWVVLYFSWQLSLPARSWMLSTFAAVSLCAAITVGLASLIVMIRRMRGDGYGRPWVAMSFFSAVLAVAAGVTGAFTYLRTEGTADQLARITSFLQSVGVLRVEERPPFSFAPPPSPLAKLSLVDAEIVLRPDGWTERSFAEKDFRADWCRREGIKDCSDLGDRAQEFKAEWQARRDVAITDLEKPTFHKNTVVDMQEAVSNAIEVARSIRILSAKGPRAIGAGVVEGFRPRGANLQGADLRGAFLSGSDLSGARLSQARLGGTRLERTKLFGADLSGTTERRTDLIEAFLEGADLRYANLQGAVLWEANLQDADLSFSLLTGSAESPNDLSSTNLTASTNDGGAVRFVGFTAIDLLFTEWRNAFIVFEGEVPQYLFNQMDRPCQWTAEALTDAEFYGRWRWWVEANPNPSLSKNWESIVPHDWRDVPLNPGPPGCTWTDEP